jgi:SAM-dependent methyltransferase
VRREHLQHLVCPECRTTLTLEGEEAEVETGTLRCATCRQEFPITRYIPRFVPAENYAASFGVEWNRHAQTQYDSLSGATLSEDRFFGETGWPRRMEGEILIEAGCGGGRFTEQAASTGGTVLSLDYSNAVDANYRLNGQRPNVLIVQGDIYHMPFPEDYADRIFCFGVIQHTPNPKDAFLSLRRHLKPGGQLVADVYLKSLARYWLQTKYLVRPLTRRIQPERLYRLVRRYVDLMWPLASSIRRVPKIGASINWRLLVADYSKANVPAERLKEWAYLDTFDMLAPRYDEPQTIDTVKEWLDESGLVGEVFRGMNGITIVAQRTEADGPV